MEINEMNTKELINFLNTLELSSNAIKVKKDYRETFKGLLLADEYWDLADINKNKNATASQIEDQVKKIVLTYGPKFGYVNVIGALMPKWIELDTELGKSKLNSTTSYETLREKELGTREAYKSLNRTDNFAKTIENFFENKNYNAKGETIN